MRQVWHGRRVFVFNCASRLSPLHADGFALCGVPVPMVFDDFHRPAMRVGVLIASRVDNVPFRLVMRVHGFRVHPPIPAMCRRGSDTSSRIPLAFSFVALLPPFYVRTCADTPLHSAAPRKCFSNLS